MELIAKVSKGSKMDQIYIPKNREGFSIGNYVLIKPLENVQGKKRISPFFYNTGKIEPIKIIIINKLFELIEKKVKNENIIITGSFLENGFDFKDIDILIIGQERSISKEIENAFGIKMHLIFLSHNALLNGYLTNPLYRLMLSKFVAKKRILLKETREIKYKILDLQLLKSKTLIDNYNLLNGQEKYYLTRNMLVILLFLQCKRINNKEVNKNIEEILGIKTENLKQNKTNAKFLKNYKNAYNFVFSLILKSIKNSDGAKQKQAY